MIATRLILGLLNQAFRLYITGQLTAPGWVVMAVKNPFTPGPGLVISDVTPDDGMGSFPLPLEDAPFVQGTDPQTTGYKSGFIAGAGVPAQQSTTAAPRSIYGWVLTEAGPGFAVMASMLLPAPVQILRVNDILYLPEMSFTLPPDLFR